MIGTNNFPPVTGLTEVEGVKIHREGRRITASRDGELFLAAVYTGGYSGVREADSPLQELELAVSSGQLVVSFLDVAHLPPCWGLLLNSKVDMADSVSGDIDRELSIQRKQLKSLRIL